MYGEHMLGTEVAVITDLWIPGRPKPKGSLKNIAKRGTRARLVEQVEGSVEWKRKVRNAVVRHVRDTHGAGSDLFPILKAVEVEAWFYFQRPADPVNPDYPCGLEGDTDKLCRNVGDALEDSRLIKDDRLIVDWTATKRFIGVHGVTLPNEEGLQLTVRLAL